MSYSECIPEMIESARFYQQALSRALGVEAKYRIRPGYNPLAEALSKIIGWQRRFQAASPEDQISPAMYFDWLENVMQPSEVYSEWASAWVDRTLPILEPEREAG